MPEEQPVVPFKVKKGNEYTAQAYGTIAEQIYVQRPWDLAPIEFPKLPKPLYFNISHSKNRIAAAVSRHPSIGVDIEFVSPKREFVKIAQRYFSIPEVKTMLCLSPASQLSRFYDLWTLKESYLKASGSGLIIPLRQFSFSFPQNEKVDITFDNKLNEKPDDWNFWQFDDGENYRLALALKPNEHQDNYKIITTELLSFNEKSNSGLLLKLCTKADQEIH